MAKVLFLGRVFCNGVHVIGAIRIGIVAGGKARRCFFSICDGVLTVCKSLQERSAPASVQTTLKVIG